MFIFDLSLLFYFLFLFFSFTLIFLIMSLGHFIILLLFLDLLLLFNIILFVFVTVITGNPLGYVVALIIIGVAAADTAVGLGLFLIYFKATNKVSIK